jgi:UDP-N-acetylmuramyl pentapeptide phosphotransferase/UDP-N-acetylglucosamine-1-phosphate transferase
MLAYIPIDLKISLYLLLGAVIAIIVSGGISIYAIRKIIFIARTRKIYDIPDDTRKIHGAQIPTLGGIGIFIGYIITAAFFWPRNHFFMPFVLASSVILFFTGIYDDIMNMRPSKKLVAQLIASFITVYFARVYPASLSGFLGIGAIPYWAGILLTTVCCTFYINVFNFIDGIDGLAGVLACLYLGVLGVLFAGMGHFAAAGIALSLAGATIGLLYYNIAPAKIYMGDTGSMFLGFTIFIFSILFLQWFTSAGNTEIKYLAAYIQSPANALMLIIGMLFLPVFDALRVFVLRASRGISPLRADRTHLHYYLLDAGFTHSHSVLIIALTNVFLIACAFLLQGLHPLLILLVFTLIAGIALFIIYRLRQQNLQRKQTI